MIAAVGDEEGAIDCDQSELAAGANHEPYVVHRSVAKYDASGAVWR